MADNGVTDLVLPDLQSIGALRVTGNSDLRNVSLPELQSVGDQNGDTGGVSVRDNPVLKEVDMGSLEDVYGGLSLHGGFTLVALFLLPPSFTLVYAWKLN